MEDMDSLDTSFTLFGQNLSTVHERDERSPPLRRHSRIAPFRIDEPRDVESDVFMAHVSMPFDDSKPHPDTTHEDEIMSSYGREGRKSKRSSFTSSKSRMSAVKKRSKICFEQISEATTPLGSGKQLRRNLFDSNNNDDSVALAKPLRSTQFGNTGNTTDASYRHSSSLQSATSMVWKKHTSLPEPICSQSTAKFSKCHSDAELLIASALSRSSDDQNLIGDYSRPFRLPVISGGKHQDLKAISHETMANVLNGGCSAFVDEYIVIDCRYPYEYEAGHITGARNIYSKDEIISQFLSSPSPQFLQKNPILIFHCEFSSERGPKLLRYLRNRDRSLHQENYPALYYPEMYLLEGGYKEFCHWHLDLCEPRDYKPMVHKDHSNELAYYRSKSRLYTSKESQAPDATATNNERMEKHKFTSLRC